MADKPARMFECECCHRTLPSEWSEEEAQAEYEARHGRPFKREEVSHVCDNCYHMLLTNMVESTKATRH